MSLVEMNVHDCIFYVDDSTYEDDEAGAHLGVHYWEKYLNHDEIAAFFHAAKEEGNAVTRTAKKAGNATERTVNRAANATERTAKRAAGGIERGAKATDKALTNAAKKTENWVNEKTK